MPRKIEQYNDKALIPILKDIIEALESNDMYLENMDDVDHNFDELSEIITDELTSYLSNVEFEDITYFIALIIMNDDFEPPLKRPELKTYRITHIYQKVETINYKYQTDMTSFIPLDNSILGELQSSGEYEPWDGNLIDENFVDSDYSEDWIENIEVL